MTVPETVFVELARALADAGHDLPRIADALRATLTTSFCDRCSVELGGPDASPAPSQRSLTPRHAILSMAGTGFVHGQVSVERDDDSPVFAAQELAAIETCIVYATLAAEVATRLEAERATRCSERDRAERFHRTMVSVVGHDMHAPASAILIGAEMLVAKHRDDPSLADVVRRIVSFATRMTGMVDQLLDLSRAQLGGGIPLARTNVRLAPLLASVIEELAARYPHNHFTLTGDAQLAGVWDPDRIRQVTTSLLTNAVRHGMPDGPIEIIMSHDEDGTRFVVRNQVRDGPIPREALPGLFEPYHRDDDARGAGGLGLGLYLVREIIEAHGGGVAVDSTATGTAFRVVLPDRPAAPAQVRPPPPSSSS